MKLQINVSDELCARIDKYAKMMGSSRSSLCAVWIGQGVMGFDRAMEISADPTFKEALMKDEDIEKHMNANK